MIFIWFIGGRSISTFLKDDAHESVVEEAAARFAQTTKVFDIVTTNSMHEGVLEVGSVKPSQIGLDLSIFHLRKSAGNSWYDKA